MPGALLVSRHAATVRTAVQVLGAAGVPIRAVGADEMADAADEGADLVLVDLDELDADVDRAVAAVAARFPSATLVALAGPAARPRLLAALEHPAVQHALPKRPVATAGDGARWQGPDEQDLLVAVRLRGARGPVGVAPYLAPLTQVHETAVTSSDDKDALLEAIVGLGTRMRLGAEKMRRIEVVADELLANALYDAPVDDTGRRRCLDPRASVALHQGERILVRHGCDGRSFAVSVADPFGSLDVRRAVEHLGKLRDPGRLVVSQGPGGAGLGLTMALGASSVLAFHVAPGRSTEVVAVVDVASGNRAAAERGAAMHFFVDERLAA